MEGLESEEKKIGKTISLNKNPVLSENNDKKPLLLIPTYKIVKMNEPPEPFRLIKDDYELLEKFIDYMKDADKVLLVKYNIKPLDIENLKKKNYLKEEKENGKSNEKIKDLDLMLRLYFKHLNSSNEKPVFDDFNEINDEIKHYKNIKVYLENIEENSKDGSKSLRETLEDRIKKFKEEREKLEKEKAELYKKLYKKFKHGEISYEEHEKDMDIIKKKIEKLEDFEYPESSEGNSTKIKLTLKHIKQHYYIPIILSEDERIDYIKHIIKVRSEVDFIKDLQKNLSKFNKVFEWWMFSKIDESLDDIYIPYYSTKLNRFMKFKPDFIFWLKLKEKNNYYIVFVDPKSPEYTDAERKIDGFEKLFTENGISKEFKHKNLTVKVKLFYISESQVLVSIKIIG